MRVRPLAISGIVMVFGPLRADAVALGPHRTAPETRSQRLVEIAADIESQPAPPDRVASVVCHSGSRKEFSSPRNPDQETTLASDGPPVAGREQT